MPTTPTPFTPADYKDRTGTWRSPQGITVPIICTNARRAYGRLELYITPIHGEGQAWVQADYVALDAGPTADIIAALLRCTPQQVQSQFAKNAKTLRQMALRAGTGRYRGYTAADLNRLADAAERKASA